LTSRVQLITQRKWALPYRIYSTTFLYYVAISEYDDVIFSKKGGIPWKFLLY
jgi:hypothetical protein